MSWGIAPTLSSSSIHLVRGLETHSHPVPSRPLRSSLLRRPTPFARWTFRTQRQGHAPQTSVTHLKDLPQLLLEMEMMLRLVP